MLIGITGTIGAGKGTIAQYLNRHHKFTYFSVRNFFAQELIRQGKASSRDDVAKVAAELKAAHGPTYALEQLLSSPHGTDAVIESIRTPQEVAFLKAKGGILWAADANVETRYQRTLKRDASIDAVTREQFMAKDAAEAALKEVMAQADVLIMCDGTLDELYQRIEAALDKTGDKLLKNRG
ncbi:MAG TPA: AAA family ATPase [Candidatus Paceibacterota bacterium]